MRKKALTPRGGIVLAAAAGGIIFTVFWVRRRDKIKGNTEKDTEKEIDS